MPMSPRLLRPVAAGGFNPSRLAGLGGWWDATDASTYTLDTGVTEWRDKSGLGQKWSQSTGANQPTVNATGIGGKAALSFNGSSSWLNLGSQNIGGNNLFAEAANAFAIYVVTKNTDTSAAARTLVAKAGGSLANRTLQVFLSNPSTGVLNVAVRGAQTISSANFLPANTDGLMLFSWSGSAAELRFNNATNSPSVSTAALESENVTLGARTASSPTVFWSGLIGEIIFYNRVLPSAEQSRLFQYLNAKWGLSLT
jgi:hypothetical protein